MSEIVNRPTPHLASFLAFARTKPADEEYLTMDPTACALGQYAISLGGVRSSGDGGILWNDVQSDKEATRFETEANRIFDAAMVSRTWGQLADALALLQWSPEQFDRKVMGLDVISAPLTVTAEDF